jgi:hypothetical protein
MRRATSRPQNRRLEAGAIALMLGNGPSGPKAMLSRIHGGSLSGLQTPSLAGYHTAALPLWRFSSQTGYQRKASSVTDSRYLILYGFGNYIIAAESDHIPTIGDNLPETRIQFIVS